MFKNYLKIALRNLQKNKGYSLINIGGLALGMTVAILISMWIHDEVSYNKVHENYDTLAQVYRHNYGQDQTYTGTSTVTGLGTLLKDEYGAHFQNVGLVRARVEERVVAMGNKKFTQKGYFVQPEIPDMFTLNMISGSRAGLHDMNSILLSESLARKLFGEADPINQIVKMDAKWDLKVTGVYQDLPKNSKFKVATYFAPLARYLNGWSHLNVWDNYNMYLFVQLQPGADFKEVSKTIKNAMHPYPNLSSDADENIFLVPMSQWHLHANYENGIPVMSNNLKFVWLYGIIGFFVLLLACINFMNLSTARSEKRSKEIGIRKTVGSLRRQLINQFLIESFIVSILAFGISLCIVQTLLPWFNEIAAKELTMLWRNAWFWLASVLFTTVTALLAGSYPAFYLSSFNPITAVKGSLRAGRYAALPRKILVVFQFTISVALIICTMIIHQQIEHVKNRPVGYTRDGLIMLRPRSPEYRGKYDMLRNELKKTGAVYEMAEADYPISVAWGWNPYFDWQGRDPNFDPSFNMFRVSHEYGKTIGWQLVEGRDFSRQYATDLEGVIINESALKLMELENPVGQMISYNNPRRPSKNYQILGVVQDMVKDSPFEKTCPAIMFLSERDLNWLFIRIHPKLSASQALPEIETVFNKIIPSAPFDYQFVDEVYAAKFAAEERIAALATFFAALAILISCLGLFGLASFVAEQRTKEIGIRKVLGASVTNLWQMLSTDFIILVIFSFFIAIPVAYHILNGWLKDYEYRIQISWPIFAVACISALFIALITVSFQAVKAALMNPVKSIKHE